MGKIAIRADRLSKQYKIGASIRHDTLRDHLVAGVKRLFRRDGQSSSRQETIWALRDVSFEVEQGDIVGIIGRNGAGKSTLLKILSGIVEPTAGRAEIWGRLVSLLEVGTGFHGELTGRENIYLNGAILGMRKAEIERKFDEIVAFSEIEKFIDTPAKHYSSGMYVRLAFAVAAHLEPEILILDEVLAVGDAAFQKKCLGKLGDVVREGRTVLLVSHNTVPIQALCQYVLLLHEGRLEMKGEPSAVISRYISEGADKRSAEAEAELTTHPGRSHSQEPALRKAWTMNGNGMRSNQILMGEGLTVCFRFRCTRPIRNPGFGFEIHDEWGRPVFYLNNYMVPTENNTFTATDAGVACFHIPHVPLVPGTYFVNLALVEIEREWVDYVERALTVYVEPADVYGVGIIPDPSAAVVFVSGEITVRVDGMGTPEGGRGTVGAVCG